MQLKIHILGKSRDIHKAKHAKLQDPCKIKIKIMLKSKLLKKFQIIIKNFEKFKQISIKILCKIKKLITHFSAIPKFFHKVS